jgi:hypothetical protein
MSGSSPSSDQCIGGTLPGCCSINQLIYQLVYINICSQLFANRSSSAAKLLLLVCKVFRLCSLSDVLEASFPRAVHVHAVDVRCKLFGLLS